MKCVSCIKDGKTGECYDIKDKEARNSIEELKTTVATLSGVDGGHLATDEDIKKLENNLATLLSTIESLEYASPQDIENLRTADGVLQEQITALDSAKANASYVESINNKVTEIIEALNNLDNTYATDSALNSVITSLNQVITTVNALSGADGGHLATDQDIEGLQTQISELEETLNNLPTGGGGSGGLKTKVFSNPANFTEVIAFILAHDIVNVNFASSSPISITANKHTLNSEGGFTTTTASVGVFNSVGSDFYVTRKISATKVYLIGTLSGHADPIGLELLTNGAISRYQGIASGPCIFFNQEYVINANDSAKAPSLFTITIKYME